MRLLADARWPARNFAAVVAAMPELLLGHSVAAAVEAAVVQPWLHLVLPAVAPVVCLLVVLQSARHPSVRRCG